ncbi:MAG: tRNA 2-thiouridine(34) synthase MnmA [Ruminococcaceae bacterium]|nr:tRNA 2-thiouridine(34) synthase MnmA [Oscillospiraceae bacterium]
MKQIMVALSGGVDSAVAAHLLQKKGYSVSGCTLQLTGLDITDAQEVANRLGVPFFSFNEQIAFRNHVIADFATCYERGETPNPCIICNKLIKFGLLLEHVLKMGYEYIATGHYAKTQYDAASGRTLLLRAQDKAKDQTYMLYSLTQHQLSHTLFPLGEFTKPQIRQIATEIGLTNANKPDSQDICFVPDGDYGQFLEGLRSTPYPQGDFVDETGNCLGHHRGIVHYTIGQRKGLGIALGTPTFVLAKDARRNRVILGPESRLFTRRIAARDINWIACKAPTNGMMVTAKTRYSQKEAEACLHMTETGVIAEFKEPQRAPAPGQAMVFYDGDVVVGGGTIVQDGETI